MTPKQQLLIERAASRDDINSHDHLPSPVHPYQELAAIAQVLLKLIQPPMGRRSDRKPNDGLGPPPLPLRKQMERAAARVMIEYESRETNALVVVDAVLDILDCDPGKLEDPTGDEDRRFGVRRYQQVIQAIRRGE